MDPNVLISLVGSLGFPIVCCGALFIQQNKHMENFTREMKESNKELTVAINENTTATTKLVTTVEIIAKIGDDTIG